MARAKITTQSIKGSVKSNAPSAVIEQESPLGVANQTTATGTPLVNEPIGTVGAFGSEIDPIFLAWLAGVHPENWDEAYSWGNHALAGYLTAETDPIFSAWLATTPPLYSETDPIWLSEKNNYYTKIQSDARYLQSYTETDPIYTASSWYTTVNNSTNWDTAYGWGNHADAGYLKTEGDPIWQSEKSNYFILTGRATGQTGYGGSIAGTGFNFIDNPVGGGTSSLTSTYLNLTYDSLSLYSNRSVSPTLSAESNYLYTRFGIDGTPLLIGELPTITDPSQRIAFLASKTSTEGYAMGIVNSGLGTVTTAIMATGNSLTGISTSGIPTHATIMGRTGSAWDDTNFHIADADSGYFYSTDGNLYLGSAGITSTTGNTYLFAGSIADKSSIRFTLLYNGNVGIGITTPSFPLQVSGRGRFNDSIGIDTDPSTFGLDLRGSINFVGSVKPTNAMTATLAGVAGNLSNGTYRYKVTYYTDIGETGISSTYTQIVVSDYTTNGQVNLANIPVSTDTKVTGRRIYRTTASSTASYYLLVDIPDNTTTTYTDNTADSGLGLYDNSNRDNTTRGHLYIDSNSIGFFGDYNTAIGLGSLGNGTNIPGYYNFALGNYALYKLNNGVQNTAIGAFALTNLVDGTSNMASGFNCLRTTVSSIGNIGYGVNAGYLVSSGNYNILVGYDAGYRFGSSSAWALKTGNYNIFYGYQAGLGSATQREKSIAIGYQALVDADLTMALGGTGANAMKVAIGRTTASETLDVNGNIIATGYKSADGSLGISGSWTTTDGKTITTKNGLITSII